MILKIQITSFLLICFSLIMASEGDTTIIRTHDKTHMKFPDPVDQRNYKETVKFPDGSTSYRKILLAYKLECPSSGCSPWDYDTHVSIMDPTGENDSTFTTVSSFQS